MSGFTFQPKCWAGRLQAWFLYKLSTKSGWRTRAWGRWRLPFISSWWVLLESLTFQGPRCSPGLVGFLCYCSPPVPLLGLWLMRRSTRVLARQQSAGLFHVFQSHLAFLGTCFTDLQRDRGYHQRPPLTIGRTELTCPPKLWVLVLDPLPAAANHGPNRKILSSLRWETSPMSLQATDAVIGPGHASQPCPRPEPETGLN